MTTEATPTTPTTPAGQGGAGAGSTPAPAGTGAAPAAGTPPAAAATPPQGAGQSPAPASAQKPAAGGGELEVTLPYGAVIDPQALSQFKEFAKSAGLNSQTASQVVGFYWEQQRALASQFQQTQASWEQENRKHAEFGGDKYDAGRKEIERVLGALDQELLKDLQEFGLVNLPSINRAAWQLRDLVKEDNRPIKPAPPTGTQSEEARLRKEYPGMFLDETPET